MAVVRHNAGLVLGAAVVLTVLKAGIVFLLFRATCARADALLEYAKLAPAKREAAEAMATAFLDAQDHLFAAITSGPQNPVITARLHAVAAMAR